MPTWEAADTFVESLLIRTGRKRWFFHICLTAVFFFYRFQIQLRPNMTLQRKLHKPESLPFNIKGQHSAAEEYDVNYYSQYTAVSLHSRAVIRVDCNAQSSGNCSPGAGWTKSQIGCWRIGKCRFPLPFRRELKLLILFPGKNLPAQQCCTAVLCYPRFSWSAYSSGISLVLWTLKVKEQNWR